MLFLWPFDSSTFSLYSDTTLAAIWSETSSVAVENGFYEAELDVDTLDFSGSCFLGLAVGGSAWSPKKLLGSVPYALALADSAITSGKIKDGEVKEADLADDAITADKISPDIVSSVDGVHNDGGNIDLAGTGGITVSGDNGANTITIGFSGATNTSGWTDDGSAVRLQTSSDNVGIGTTSPSRQLDIESGASADGIDINNTASNGDPMIRFQLSGTDKFSIGVDDTGDDFKISTGDVLGTTDRLVVEENGNGTIDSALYVGTDNGSNNDYVRFDSGSESLEWDEGSTRFEMSDNLAMLGPLAVAGTTLPTSTTSYNYFTNYSGVPSPASGAMGNAGDLYVKWDFETGYNRRSRGLPTASSARSRSAPLPHSGWP